MEQQYPRRRDLRMKEQGLVVVERPVSTGDVLPSRRARRQRKNRGWVTVVLLLLVLSMFAGCSALAYTGVRTALEPSPPAPSVAETFDASAPNTTATKDDDTPLTSVAAEPEVVEQAAAIAEAVEPVGDVEPEESVEILDVDTEEDPLGVVQPKVPAGDGDITGVPASSGVLKAMPARQVQRVTVGPNRLFIPSAGTYAKIRSGAITNNQLDIPRSPAQVGMWSGGIPAVSDSATGNTVISGHINYNGVRGALYNLSTLRKGTVAYTSDAKGNTTKWKLVALNQYPKTALPGYVFDTQGVRRLVLVTCGGVVVNHHYKDNVVAVFVPA